MSSQESRRVALLVDSGGLCDLEACRFEAVHDLATLGIPDEPVPVRFVRSNHDGPINHDGPTIGFCDRVEVRDHKLYAFGSIRCGHGDPCRHALVEFLEKRELENDPVLLSCSAGTFSLMEQFVGKGERVKVNSRVFEGEIEVLRCARLDHIAVTAEYGGVDKGSYCLIEGMFGYSDLRESNRKPPTRECLQAALCDYLREVQALEAVKRDSADFWARMREDAEAQQHAAYLASIEAERVRCNELEADLLRVGWEEKRRLAAAAPSRPMTLRDEMDMKAAVREAQRSEFTAWAAWGM